MDVLASSSGGRAAAPIYLDYNATTPLAREVCRAMASFLEPESALFGNPSSAHYYGTQTKHVVETARKQVSELLGCAEDEVVFTSGGSESNNFAIKGVSYYMREKKRGNRIITSSIEHPAVLETCRFLEKEGFAVSYVGCDENGVVNVDEISQALQIGDAILVTIMHANNETGAVQPVAAIAQLARRHAVLFHTDASQSIGKIPTKVDDLGVDLLTVCPHKFYGPKGIGALYVRTGTPLQKLVHGAAHERDMRAGTESIMLVAGLGAACLLASRHLQEFASHMAAMRDRLYEGLVNELGAKCLRLNGPPPPSSGSESAPTRLPNTLSVCFHRVHANTLLAAITPRVAASAGAACHSNEDIELSHVLRAMKVPIDYAQGTIRLSTGRHTTKEEIDEAIKVFVEQAKKLLPLDSDGVSDSAIESFDLEDSADSVRLTTTTHGLGCGCKMRPQILERVVRSLPRPTDPNVLVGTETSDDAGVYRVSEEVALVQTVDFFTPIVDRAYDYGAIAAANSLSDVYAMGGVPLTALNIVGFPTGRLPTRVLQEVLRGAYDKALEAGVSVLGGHTIDDQEMKFGMSVTGRVHPGRMWLNSTAQVGDALVLTKPIGSGIATTAMKRMIASEATSQEAVRTMSMLNKYAADALRALADCSSGSVVHACTDVTGFGLLGHLKELSVGSGVDVTISYSKVPLITGVWEHAVGDIIPGGSKANHAWLQEHVHYSGRVGAAAQLILCDAQTSGGLLFAVPADSLPAVLDTLQNVLAQGNVGCCAVIG